MEIPLYFFRRRGRDGAAYRLRRILFHPDELARAALWIAARRRDHLAHSARDGSGPSATFPQHAARLQTSLAHVGGRVDSYRIWRVRRSGVDRFRIARQSDFSGTIDQLVIIVAGTSLSVRQSSDLCLATYTGVLIGATAIPAWFFHRILLPIHSELPGLGCAAGDARIARPSNCRTLLSRMLLRSIETVLWIWLGVDRHGAADRAIHERRSGWLIRVGKFSPVHLRSSFA